MKPILKMLFIYMALFTINWSQAQQDKVYPPTEGKAVVYILRTQGMGALMNFRFFEKGDFIGKFNGVNYLRYECNPGKSLFWVKAENVDFIETDLEANKIYFVEANARIGAFSSAVKFKIVDFENEKQMKRINKLLNKKEPKTFTDEELRKEQTKKQSVIGKGMRRVQVKRKETKPENIKRITTDMNYKMN